MHEFIYWPKPYLFLSVTHDFILSWMTGIWMRHHLESDSNCNIVIDNPPKNIQGLTNNVGLRFTVGDTLLRFTISVGEDNLELVTQNTIFNIVSYYRWPCVQSRLWMSPQKLLGVNRAKWNSGFIPSALQVEIVFRGLNCNQTYLIHVLKESTLVCISRGQCAKPLSKKVRNSIIHISAREVVGYRLVKILVILNPAGYMLTSSGFAFNHLRYIHL